MISELKKKEKGIICHPKFRGWHRVLRRDGRKMFVFELLLQFTNDSRFFFLCNFWPPAAQWHSCKGFPAEEVWQQLYFEKKKNLTLGKLGVPLTSLINAEHFCQKVKWRKKVWGLKTLNIILLSFSKTNQNKTSLTHWNSPQVEAGCHQRQTKQVKRRLKHFQIPSSNAVFHFELS